MFGLRPKKDDGELSVWMDEVEFSQLIAVIEALGPRRVVEWGSGGSTKALLERCPFIERLVSVEHVPAWHAKVAAGIDDPRLELHLVEPDRPLLDADPTRQAVIAWDLRAELEPELMASYVGLPATLGTRFDFALIDGRARRLCLAAGYDLLEPGGCMMLHDAQREEYHDACDALASRGARVVFLEPYRAGQHCLVRKPG